MISLFNVYVKPSFNSFYVSFRNGKASLSEILELNWKDISLNAMLSKDTSTNSSSESAFAVNKYWFILWNFVNLIFKK